MKRTVSEFTPVTDPSSYAEELEYNRQKHRWGWRKAFEKYLQMEYYAQIEAQIFG